MSKIFYSGECLLCGCSHCDEGGGSVVKRSGKSDSSAFVLFFCLDCLDDRLDEVKEQENKIIKEEHLVRL